jgi:uncharacterized membrane protein
MEKQSRWRSKILWASIFAQILSLLQLSGALEGLGIDAGVAGDAVASFLQLLAIIGILNNPENPNAL